MLTFIDLIFPPKCSFCGKMDNVDHDSFVCSKCINNLPFYKEEYRYHNTSISRETPFKSLDAVYCLFKYTNNVKKAFIRYKFQGDISVYKSFAILMYDMLLCEKAFESVDYITAVPISDEKFAQRGFNQSLLIANEISKLSGIQYMELLKRPYQGVTQSKVSAEERLHAKERFSVIDNRLNYVVNLNLWMRD